MQEKLAITVLVITLALFALIMVLYRIIRDNNEQYKKIVLTQRQQEYESRVIPYRRGDIVDRNGTYLATSDKVYNLIIDCTQIMAKPEDTLEPTIAALVSAFGYDGAELRRLITENPESPYIRYERQLTNDQKEVTPRTRAALDALVPLIERTNRWARIENVEVTTLPVKEHEYGFGERSGE